jgi:hypothetical protein
LNVTGRYIQHDEYFLRNCRCWPTRVKYPRCKRFPAVELRVSIVKSVTAYEISVKCILDLASGHEHIRGSEFGDGPALSRLGTQRVEGLSAC